MIQEHLGAAGDPLAGDPLHPLPAAATDPPRAAAVESDDVDLVAPCVIRVGSGAEDPVGVC